MNWYRESFSWRAIARGLPLNEESGKVGAAACGLALNDEEKTPAIRFRRTFPAASTGLDWAGTCEMRRTGGGANSMTNRGQ
jgi:hypothetical protein